MNDEYFYFIIYLTNYFIKGQNLNCVYCINVQKKTLGPWQTTFAFGLSQAAQAL